MYKLFLILFLSLMTNATQAQRNLIDIGVEGGGGLSSLSGNGMIKKYHRTRIGYAAGVFIQYNFKKIFSLRTGCSFERKGSAFKFEATDATGQPIGTIHGKETFDFLTIPLLIRASLGKKIFYFINAGPYIGLLLKATEQTDAFMDFPEINSDQTDYYKKNETGLSAGIGLSLNLKNKVSFSIEARDNLGLSNIGKAVANNSKIKTNSLHLLLGICFKFGQRKTDDKK